MSQTTPMTARDERALTDWESEGGRTAAHAWREHAPTAAGALYRVGLALFDLDAPERCLLRGNEWIFGPEAPYEQHGDVDNVTFPSGYTVGADGDQINLYYGAADTSIALATGSIGGLLAWLDRRGRPGRHR